MLRSLPSVRGACGAKASTLKYFAGVGGASRAEPSWLGRSAALAPGLVLLMSVAFRTVNGRPVDHAAARFTCQPERATRRKPAAFFSEAQIVKERGDGALTHVNAPVATVDPVRDVEGTPLGSPLISLLDVQLQDCTGLHVVERVGPDRMATVIFNGL